MTLSFFTENHKMTFVDAVTHQVQNAWQLVPNRSYRVYFVIQNSGNTEQNAQCHITHTPFGIGLPGTTNNVVQPQPVVVPPKGPASDGVTSGNGLATVMFHYQTPPGGHSCLSATIAGATGVLQQNTQVISMPIGTAGAYSFLVFGGAAPETMIIEVAESTESGTAGSWQPKIKAPAGVGPTTATAPPVNLNLAANQFYSIELIVTPSGAPGTVHVFHVTGKVNGVVVGAVDIRIQVGPALPLPAPYIHGGYQSDDIILIDSNGHQVPIGANQAATQLLPDTDYSLAARIHNASPTPADNTVVRFWQFPHGNASVGQLIDVQTATIQAAGTTVYAAHPFHTPPAGVHSCAVVSIYNARAGTCPDAVTGTQVPSPGSPTTQSCSAWRNTDSMNVVIGQPWTLTLGVNFPPDIKDPGPVEVRVITQHVPAAWHKDEKVLKAVGEMEKVGRLPATPMAIVPALRGTLKTVDLGLDVKLKGRMPRETMSVMAVKPFRLADNVTLMPAMALSISLKEIKEVPFTISGTVPKDVKAGDQLIVHVIAHYPKSEMGAARDIEFIEFLNVTRK
jgi:hypothetical protein